MRDRLLVTVMMAALSLAGCGGGETQDRPPEASAEVASAEETMPINENVTLNNDGSVRTHTEAGFSIYWPAGCGRLRESLSDGVTPHAAQEQIYNCEPEPGRGFSVRHYHRAQTEDGSAASPRFVVDLVEQQMKRYGVTTKRQRPLEGGTIQGVEVQGVHPAGAGEVWIRGLLIGAEVYVLTAWNDQGGLFDDVDVADFFHSFRVIP